MLREFQTTHASLMLANPNLDPTATEMQAGESVCVLPDICTQVRGDTNNKKIPVMEF